MTRGDYIPARTRAARREHGPVTTPLYTLGATAVFAAGVLVLILTDNAKNATLFVTLVLSTLPSLGAAFFSERASRDVRNGVVEEKARKGAHKALKEAGVTDAVATGAQTTPAVLAGLTRLLEETEAGKVRRAKLSDLLPHEDTKGSGST